MACPHLHILTPHLPDLGDRNTVPEFLEGPVLHVGTCLSVSWGKDPWSGDLVTVQSPRVVSTCLSVHVVSHKIKSPLACLWGEGRDKEWSLGPHREGGEWTHIGV